MRWAKRLKKFIQFFPMYYIPRNLPRARRFDLTLLDRLKLNAPLAELTKDAITRDAERPGSKFTCLGQTGEPFEDGYPDFLQ